MREDRLQNQVSGGLPAPPCSESEPDQAGGPKTGVSVPVGPPDDGPWPDEGDVPKPGLAVPSRGEAK